MLEVKKLYIRFIIYFVFALLLGIIIGSVLGSLHADLNFSDWLLLWLIILLFALIIILYNILKPNRLLIKGKYNRAIKHFIKISKKYKNNNKIKNASIYNIALCYHRMGDFASSEKYLNRLDLNVIDNNLKWGYYKLSATNLVLLKKKGKKLQKYIDNAKNIYNLPELYPVISYVETLKKNNITAEFYINTYLNKPKIQKYILSFSNYSLITDNFTYEIENNFFIGLAYLKMKNNSLAMKYFQQSCNCKYDNYYSHFSEVFLGKLNKVDLIKN